MATIVAKIGKWGPRLVLFRGMAPRYIVRELPEELENAGFSPRNDASFAWERRVAGIPVVLEFFSPVRKGGRPGRPRLRSAHDRERHSGPRRTPSRCGLETRGYEHATRDERLGQPGSRLTYPTWRLVSPRHRLTRPPMATPTGLESFLRCPRWRPSSGSPLSASRTPAPSQPWNSGGSSG